MSERARIPGRIKEAAADAAAAPLLDHLLLFVAALREAGIGVSTQQTLDLAEALRWIELDRRRSVYFAARAFLVTRKEDLALFDALFHRFFHADDDLPRPQKAPRAPRHAPPAEERFNIVSYRAHKARVQDREIEVADRSESYSSAEALRAKDFSDMSPEELERVRRMIRELRWRASLRRTRRRVPKRRGESLDLRRAVRETLRYDAVPAHLPRLERKLRQRPVVLLADISGSMEKYSRLVLLFFYGLCRSLARAEAFVFATRLSHVTPQLRLRNVDRALEEAGRQVIDWSGGTRIGECLGEFNRRYSRRVLRRGAIVLVVSDGWERGDVEELRREMRYLHHRCARLIWLNPLSGRPGYRPLVEGMAAALPWIDDFLPIHNLQSVEEFAEHLERLPSRSRPRSRASHTDSSFAVHLPSQPRGGAQ